MLFKGLLGQLNFMGMPNLPVLSSQILLVKNVIYIQFTGTPFYILCDYLSRVFSTVVTVVKEKD